jgi:hypothetical protein
MGSLLTPWTSNPWAVSVLLIIVFACLYAPVRRLNARWNGRFIFEHLRHMKFFHALYVGKSSEHINLEGTEVWFDAWYTIVVKKDGKPMGLIGFDLTPHALRVRQIQGLKGANFKGVPVGHFLLPYAETIARKLGREEVWVQAAERNIYFARENLEDENRLAELYAHRHRMVGIYNTSATDRGYGLEARGAYVLGYYKTLRKRITMKRLFRLHLLWLNRSLRTVDRSLIFTDELWAP